jgi:DMSO/TMAO reductase YedYZ molybdopterin-dependent catalytic subunit
MAHSQGKEFWSRAPGDLNKMWLTKRHVYTTLDPMRNVRLASTGIAMLFCCAVLLAAQSAQELKLVVTGDVPTPLTLNASDLAAMPREHVELTEQDGGKTTYEGVPLQEILKRAGIPFGRAMRGKALAAYVLAEAKDGYAVAFSLGELDPDLGGTRVIVADTRDGKPLFSYQGPIRLVIPADKEGARSVRMLEKLEVVKLRE